jgi:di/tricarboxylate transporter
MVPVAALSSILNNTPVVAMLIPAVADWAKRHAFPVSKLMMPLSYAAIVGGLCTLVGTSTNLVLNGMLINSEGGSGLGMFELAWIGVPCVLITVGYVLVAERWLLPNRAGASARFEDARQYIVEMLLEDDSPLVGRTIEEAGLRHLPSVYLVEIERGGRLLTAVAPHEQLVAGDRLMFAGDVEAVVDLQKIRGLVPAETQIFKLHTDRAQRCLVEVVVSGSFPARGRSVREMEFRNRYGGAIIAVSRQGQNIRGRIGDIVLEPGDTLLVETDPGFVRRQQYSRDFLLVSELENSRPLAHERRYRALAILLAMVVSVSAGLFSMFEAALLAGGAMVLTRCTSVHGARQSVDWQVLLVIAASIALGTAVEISGAAATIADSIIELVAESTPALLLVMFTLTAVFTALISNVAAAVLMFPIATASASELGIDPTPLVITLMVAASASFATPIGYQTNLMVYGPGDYRFGDFLRMGVPLTVLIGLCTVLLVPLIWPP